MQTLNIHPSELLCLVQQYPTMMYLRPFSYAYILELIYQPHSVGSGNMWPLAVAGSICPYTCSMFVPKYILTAFLRYVSVFASILVSMATMRVRWPPNFGNMVLGPKYNIFIAVLKRACPTSLLISKTYVGLMVCWSIARWSHSHLMKCGPVQIVRDVIARTKRVCILVTTVFCVPTCISGNTVLYLHSATVIVTTIVRA